MTGYSTEVRNMLADCNSPGDAKWPFTPESCGKIRFGGKSAPEW
ncbi:hypothetical protein ApDm4_0126 [Acetobacter pomorum]|nr:hypothetical protein ApDm4_0126 [Acetobacter pomorum]